MKHYYSVEDYIAMGMKNLPLFIDMMMLLLSWLTPALLYLIIKIRIFLNGGVKANVLGKESTACIRYMEPHQTVSVNRTIFYICTQWYLYTNRRDTNILSSISMCNIVTLDWCHKHHFDKSFINMLKCWKMDLLKR